MINDQRTIQRNTLESLRRADPSRTNHEIATANRGGRPIGSASGPLARMRQLMPKTASGLKLLPDPKPRTPGVPPPPVASSANRGARLAQDEQYAARMRAFTTARNNGGTNLEDFL